MTEQAANTEPTPRDDAPAEGLRFARLVGIHRWIREEGPWWMCSFAFHVILVLSLALLGSRVAEVVTDAAPSFEEAKIDKTPEAPQDIERFELGDTPEDPTELNTETLTLEKPGQIEQEERYYDENPVFTERGGGITATSDEPNLGGVGGFDVKNFGAGPALKGKGGVGIGVGAGIRPGAGGEGFGFGGRGTGSRQALLASGGGTRQSERAVAGALNWLARHQSSDGSWSLTAFKTRCKDASCSGVGAHGFDSAATALALLPFLGAGQTHESRGPYKRHIAAGIYFLVRNQKADGDLRMGATMYAHGLAAIVLCECYGMTGDKSIKHAAQRSLDFIVEAQDPTGGGWRYEPQQPGDTSVTGWQVMALKSGQMAYLSVKPSVLEKAKAFLKSVSSGADGSAGGGGIFNYVLPNDGHPQLTAVGLLCYQYLGVPRNDPAMLEGTAYLMGRQPDISGRDSYYWYYATQAMHNQPGPDWDVWNRKMRRILIAMQCKEKNCAQGSWDPALPEPDAWEPHGGRLMMTSLSALTLEVYYRYLPLYKLDK